MHAKDEHCAALLMECNLEDQTWGTNEYSQVKSHLYLLSCALNSYTQVLMNGNSTTSRVAVRIFSFVNLTVVYLHCQVQLCIEMGSNTCTAVSTSCFGNNALSFTAMELISHLTWMSLLAVMVVSHKTRMIVSPCRTVYKELLGQQRQLEELLGHLGLY